MSGPVVPDPRPLLDALAGIGRGRREALAVAACGLRDRAAGSGDAAGAELWSALACLAGEVGVVEDRAVESWTAPGVATIEHDEEPS